MMIIHLQHSLVYNDTAHISCITTNYSVYNENVHPFWGAAFAASESNFSLSFPQYSPATAGAPPRLALGSGWGDPACPWQGSVPVRALSAPHLGLELLGAVWGHRQQHTRGFEMQIAGGS